jgi:uncharacterized protein
MFAFCNYSTIHPYVRPGRTTDAAAAQSRLLIPGPQAHAILLPLGTWLALARPASHDEPDRAVRVIPALVLAVLAATVGCVGGIYGIGGGSILAPVLIGTGRRPSQVAPLPWPQPW